MCRSQKSTKCTAQIAKWLSAVLIPGILPVRSGHLINTRCPFPPSPRSPPGLLVILNLVLPVLPLLSLRLPYQYSRVEVRVIRFCDAHLATSLSRIACLPIRLPRACVSSDVQHVTGRGRRHDLGGSIVSDIWVTDTRFPLIRTYQCHHGRMLLSLGSIDLL